MLGKRLAHPHEDLEWGGRAGTMAFKKHKAGFRRLGGVAGDELSRRS